MSEQTIVIGAGVSGLCALRGLLRHGVAATCLEASDDVGGNWYFGNPNGWSSAYRSLHLDVSTGSIAFSDFPMDRALPDYPHHSDVHGYLRSFADAFGLRDHISFGSTVTAATRDTDGGWTVTTADGSVRRAARLVVANGHHWDPSLPSLRGAETFAGTTLHSHDYVDPALPVDMRGRRVLVVGMGNSAVDIACELSRRGVADRVVLSTRSGAWIAPKYLLGRPVDQLSRTRAHLPLRLQRRVAERMLVLLEGRPERFGLPTPSHRFLEAHPTVSSELLLRLGSGDLTVRPDVARLTPDGVDFVDGHHESVDIVVYATGYRVTFPFLDPALVSAPDNVLPLYKRMFSPGLPDLAFAGLVQAYPTVFPLVEAQGELLGEWAAGTWALPAVDEQQRAIDADDRRFLGAFAPRARHTMQHDTRLYCRDLQRSVLPAGRRRAA